jgi:hypothetical protein
VLEQRRFPRRGGRRGSRWQRPCSLTIPLEDLASFRRLRRSNGRGCKFIWYLVPLGGVSFQTNWSHRLPSAPMVSSKVGMDKKYPPRHQPSRGQRTSPYLQAMPGLEPSLGLFSRAGFSLGVDTLKLCPSGVVSIS